MPTPNSPPHVAIVIPVHSHFDYAGLAIRSAFESTITPDQSPPLVIVVDDASPESRTCSGPELMGINAKTYGDNLQIHRFDDRQDYIATINRGFRLARQAGALYTCAANSDLIFTPGWNAGLEAALVKDYALVGPISNAPGTELHQGVQGFVENYKLTDNLIYLSGVAANLAARYAGAVLPGPINGFCMYARTASWWQHAYDDLHVFNPFNPVNSRGQTNPTPKQTLSEYVFQGRLAAAGCRVGVVPSSFVFHFRSVSRGERYATGGWYRKS